MFNNYRFCRFHFISIFLGIGLSQSTAYAFGPGLNHAPTGVSQNLGTYQGASLGIQFHGVDSDGSVTMVKITSLTQNSGSLNVTVGSVFPIGQMISFSAAEGYLGESQIAFRVIDNRGKMSDADAFVRINIQRNSLPIPFNSTVTLPEGQVNLVLNIQGADYDGSVTKFRITSGPHLGWLNRMTNVDYSMGSNIIYTPVSLSTDDVIEFVLIDNRGAVSSHSGRIRISLNRAPIAQNRHYYTDSNHPIELSFLGYDPDGYYPAKFRIDAFPTAGSVDAYALHEYPYGTRLNYVPHPDFCGSVELKFSVQDQRGLWSQSPGTITISARQAFPSQNGSFSNSNQTFCHSGICIDGLPNSPIEQWKYGMNSSTRHYDIPIHMNPNSNFQAYRIAALNPRKRGIASCATASLDSYQQGSYWGIKNWTDASHWNIDTQAAGLHKLCVIGQYQNGNWLDRKDALEFNVRIYEDPQRPSHRSLKVLTVFAYGLIDHGVVKNNQPLPENIVQTICGHWPTSTNERSGALLERLFQTYSVDLDFQQQCDSEQYRITDPDILNVTSTSTYSVHIGNLKNAVWNQVRAKYPNMPWNAINIVHFMDSPNGSAVTATTQPSSDTYPVPIVYNPISRANTTSYPTWFSPSPSEQSFVTRLAHELGHTLGASDKYQGSGCKIDPLTGLPMSGFDLFCLAVQSSEQNRILIFNQEEKISLTWPTAKEMGLDLNYHSSQCVIPGSK